MPRRKFLRLSAATMGAVGSLGAAPAAESGHARSQHPRGSRPRAAPIRRGRRAYNSEYAGEYLNQVAFPLGGLGAGMICLEGTGALSHVSLRNQPEVFNEPCVFAAISVKGKRPAARVLEGPVPGRKLFGAPGAGNGAGGSTYGLPRFANATFKTRFPFGVVTLADPQLPLSVEITGWSPFEPGDPDNSSLPVAALEYRFTNRSKGPVEAVFSFNAKNFMAREGNPQAVRPVAGGFILWGGGSKEKPWEEAAFSATVSEPGVKVNYALVPRRLVGRADHGLERRGRRGVLRPRAAHRRADPAPGRACSFPSSLPPAHPRPSCCAWRGSPGKPTCASAKTSLASSPTRTSRPTTARGMPGGSPTSTASPSIGATITTTCGRRPAGSAIASMTPPCRPRSLKRWPRT